jgi:hypothetical protein
MFSGNKAKNADTQEIDNPTKIIYLKAYHHLEQTLRLIDRPISFAKLNHPDTCGLMTQQTIRDHRSRMDTLNKMMRNEAISQEEFSLLLKWQGIKNNPVFKNYPNVLKKASSRNSR